MLDTDTQIQAFQARAVTGAGVEQLVGNTPLLQLGLPTHGISPGVQILAKAEWYNPGGSVKDRAALSIIRTAEAAGQLDKDRILTDATSGNTGIAFAMLGAAFGYRVKLVLPGNASPERIAILRAFGAELVFSDTMEGTDGSIQLVREMVGAEPHRYYYADQYSNPANWEAHYCTTGPEIWHQTSGQITHFVAGLGTSGTMMGVGRFLRAMNPKVRLVAVQPSSPLHGLEGLKHMETTAVPAIYRPGLVDEVREVETESAHDIVRRMARELGLFVGVSAGAAVAASIDLARELDHGTIVTVLPDGGCRYMSDPFWTVV
jgi:cysteine synthase B